MINNRDRMYCGKLREREREFLKTRATNVHV